MNIVRPEIELFTAIIKKDPERELLQYSTHKEFQWKRFDAIVRRNGLHGLVFRDFIEPQKRHIPQQLYNKQRLWYQKRVISVMTMSYELLKITDFITSCSIHALAFKGPALAKCYYGDLNARTYSDLDILVMPSDVKTCIATLKELGYEYKESNCSVADFNKHIRIRQECTLVQRERGILIDLHWGFHKTTVTYIKDVTTLFKRAVDIELVPGKVLKTVAPVDLFFVESVHLFDDFSKKYFSLKLLTDYLKIAESLSEDEWQQTITIHRENRQLKKLCCWCSLLKIVFQVSFPPIVEAELANKSNVRQVKLAGIVAEQFFEPATTFDIKYLYLLSTLFDSKLDSVRFLLHLLLFSITDENKFRANMFIKMIFRVLKPIRALAIKLVK